MEEGNAFSGKLGPGLTRGLGTRRGNFFILCRVRGNICLGREGVELQQLYLSFLV